jgi:23S rRNA (cytidine1920-2'-O)/16S rRNA (cytidine1409-2'-O)-methyltransferase
MPRLDVWLVETGQFSSRQAAKRAIKDGLVTVNGKKSKPSTQVSEKDTIELLSSEADVPQGYQKLKEIDNLLQNELICDSCTALDIGSSAGGFLIYLAERSVSAIGIEVSKRFSDNLQAIVEKYPNISVLFADAFDLDPSIITDNEQLGLLLVDVTTDPEGTLKLIEKFTPLLKRGARMLAAFKLKPNSEDISTITDEINRIGYHQVTKIVLDETRQEVHITALHT